MTEHEQHDPSWPENDEPGPDKRPAHGDKQRRPFTPDPSGRAKRGSDFQDADLYEPPIEDPDDQIPD